MVGKTWQDHEKYGNFKNSQNCWFHEGNWGFNDGNWDFPSRWKSIVFLFRNDLQMVDMGMLNNGVFPAVTVIGKLAIQKFRIVATNAGGAFSPLMNKPPGVQTMWSRVDICCFDGISPAQKYLVVVLSHPYP